MRRPFGETRARIAFSNAFWYALRALVSFFGIQVFAIEGQWGLAAHKARIHSAWRPIVGPQVSRRVSPGGY